MTLSLDPPAQETLDAVESWIALKKGMPHNRNALPARQHVGNILRFLGLPVVRERPGVTSEDRPVKEHEIDSVSDHRRIHFIAKPNQMADDGVKGAPQFGSQPAGGYHVYCLWEDARPDRIWQIPRIRKNAQNPDSAVIVIYLNALTDAERQDIRRYSWENNCTLAILDEILLEYLAGSGGGTPSPKSGIFREFLSATLPYTASNPYDPESGWGTRVPREMFYGREELAREIMTTRGGTSFVFGGRQLGKTALLTYVKETFSNLGENHFAWLIDLKDRGFVQTASTGTASKPSNILKIIHEQFCSEGILTDSGWADNLDQVRREIVSVFENDPGLQVIAMFDESDAFLQLDSLGGSVAIESMRALMNETSGRFKVVFAGLHNVQRFAGGPNNPFPNLGFNSNNPRRGGIGPLQDYEARQLVEEPSGLLGFRFEPLAVDRILSYTNRHPSLLQFLLHELIETWRRSHRDASPPFVIGNVDVDRACRTKGIQDGIRRRFEETFKLDPRYHIIALTMIHFQERPTQKWSLNDIREFCQDSSSIFDTKNLEDLELQSLLNELIGLGILAEDDGSYRMRNSLIPQMFGNNTEIVRMLEELAASEQFDLLTTQMV